MTVLSPSPGQTAQAQSSSVANSTPSATPVIDDGLIKACAEAVEELRAARNLLASQKKQIALQADLLALERQISERLKNIRTLDTSEKDALRDAIAAKDVVIGELKKKQWSIWKAVKAGLIGAAAGVIAVTVLK